MKNVNGLLGVHCENGQLVNVLTAKLREEGKFAPHFHALSRPCEVEAEAISRILYISRIIGWPVCVVHLSSALGLSEIRKARAYGVKVMVETCPQYLFLDDAKLYMKGFEGSKYVCSPPLRTSHDLPVLIEALSKGEINTVATDHCSYNYHKQKELGRDDFSLIPNGMPGLEHRPVLIYSLVKRGMFSLERMCQVLSTTAAKNYGLYPQKGILHVGSDADMVIWEPGSFGVITAKNQKQNVDYTPYEGMARIGRPREVLLHGRVVVKKGELVGNREGKFLYRQNPDLA